MYRHLDQYTALLARTLAFAGGAVLLALIVLNCFSIIGRAMVPLDIGLGPIRGIYDFTEIGMAAAIFAFLPWAQYKEAHARVDLFLPVMPRLMDKLLELLFNTTMLVAAGIGSWRLYLGMTDKMNYGETTLIAQFPVWYGYAAGLVGAAGFVLVAAFCVLRSGLRIREPQ
ncbi:TRAP transporter small permease [Halovulum sp. GXIMD14793]